MNRKQLTLILLALAIFGIAGLALINHNKDTWSAPQGHAGRLLFPDFTNLDDVAVVHLKDAADLHLGVKDGTWRVRERSDYPADFSRIREMVKQLAGLKISQSEPIGPSQLARMELDSPGKGTNSATLVEFLDKQGKPLRSVLLGKKSIEESSRPSPFGGGESANGRYVMLPDDTKDLLLVSDPLNSIELNPEAWLDKENFFKVENLQSISLLSTNATNSWKLTRETANAPWVLADTNAGETLDSNKVSSLATALGYASFVDVATNTAPTNTGLDKPLALTLATFDHFTYDIKVGGRTPEENNLYMTVAVAADIPTNRVAAADEKPDDKTKLDADFQTRTKTLHEKLAKEKTLAPWVFVVTSMQMDPLIRDRSQLLVDKKEERPADTNAPPPATNVMPPLIDLVPDVPHVPDRVPNY
jgi:hypothetical protein